MIRKDKKNTSIQYQTETDYIITFNLFLNTSFRISLLL